jgi:hypothetical protein
MKITQFRVFANPITNLMTSIKDNGNKLNIYCFSWLLILFLFMGISHAEKLVTYKCYLSGENSKYVDLKGKKSETPIYPLELEIKNNAYTISSPSRAENLRAQIQDDNRIISFTHKYFGKPPCSRKEIEMTDQWVLTQDIEDKFFWDLTITFDPKHNFLGKTPKKATHHLFCAKSETQTPAVIMHLPTEPDQSGTEDSSEEDQDSDETSSSSQITSAQYAQNLKAFWDKENAEIAAQCKK